MPDRATGAGGSGLGGLGGLGGAAGAPGDDRLVVPEGLSNMPLDGQGGPLTLVAYTLVPGATGPSLYAAVRNDGQTPVCEAGMTTFFFDKADQPVTDTATGLWMGRLYRMAPDVVLACVDPGQIAMAGSTDLPASIVIGELGYLKHRFPHFVVDGIQPVDGLAVSRVETVTTGAGSAYTGTLTNGLDVTVSNPSVRIFPVNRVGRPLGMASSSATSDIPPGGSWTFQTSTVDDLGASFVAYPTAAIPL
jgi:hypothetical protein